MFDHEAGGVVVGKGAKHILYSYALLSHKPMPGLAWAGNNRWLQDPWQIHGPRAFLLVRLICRAAEWNI